MEMKGNESAFPIVVELMNDPRVEQGGLTKRELIAAMLGSGAMSMADVDSFGVKDAARVAVEFADALLAELAKSKEGE